MTYDDDVSRLSPEDLAPFFVALRNRAALLD